VRPTVEPVKARSPLVGASTLARTPAPVATAANKKLGRHRECTAARLNVARRRLEKLHWWNRGRRSELETDIARDRQMAARAERKAAQLRRDAEFRSQRLALARGRDAPSSRRSGSRRASVRRSRSTRCREASVSNGEGAPG